MTNSKLTQIITHLKPKYFFQIFVLLAVLALISGNLLIFTSRAIARNFSGTARFSVTGKGNIAIIGNTLLTCQTPLNTNCAAARDGTATGTLLDNNNYNMGRIDVDADTTTNNSSSATLSLPASSTIVWAGLYMLGDSSTNAIRTTIKFDTPDVGGYSTAFSSQDDTIDPFHMQFRDVTALVQAGGNGIYTTSAGETGFGFDKAAGWGLVVAYTNAIEPPRFLAVYDGFRLPTYLTPSTVPVTIPLGGFTAPPAGTVKAQIGMIVADGDRNQLAESVVLNSTTLSDALNPSNNFFNSTISNLGVAQTNRDPNFNNTLGFDIDIINADGIIPNNATTATLTENTTGDAFTSGVVTTAIEVGQPNIDVTKSFTDINGGSININDELLFTLTSASNGATHALNNIIEDTINSNLNYVPGTLEVFSGANVGVKTDVASDDQAEYNSVTKKVTFRLGTGANTSSGGTVNSGTSTTVRFRVKVSNTVTNGQVITNVSNSSFSAPVVGYNFITNSNTISMTVVIPPTELTGIVYTDTNRDSIKQVGEAGLGGVTVNVLNSTTNAILYTGVTPASGIWTIVVVAGTYKIDVIPPATKVITGSTNLNTVTAVVSTTVNAGDDGINDPTTDLRARKFSCGTNAAGGNELIAGQLCAYPVAFNNLGPDTSTTLKTIVDTLPSKATYIGFAQGPASSGWTCTHNTGVVTCTNSQSIPSGSSSGVFINTRISAL